MTVLFGTVEYFEREIQDAMSKGERFTEDQLKAIYSHLESDILNDFVCDEIVREQCLQNLISAYEKIHEAMLVIH